MSLATRTILILTLIFALTGGLLGQETAATTATTTATAAPASTAAETTTEAPKELGSYEIRNQLTRLLQESPSELATILVLDPTLLSNDPFLTGYPALSRFVVEHPEVRRNPRFFLAEFENRRERRNNVVDDILEGISVAFMTSLFLFAFIWLVRTFIEQRRWNRLSRTQAEVHNKILDRFGSTPELLDYIRTPAGSKFLESAPIPLHSEQAPAQNPSHTRVLWSIQIGVIVASAALGMLVVSTRFDAETAQGFFAMGVIAFCIGAGFILSALISIFFTRRLAAWQTPIADRFADDTGQVR